MDVWLEASVYEDILHINNSQLYILTYMAEFSLIFFVDPVLVLGASVLHGQPAPSLQVTEYSFDFYCHYQSTNNVLCINDTENQHPLISWPHQLIEIEINQKYRKWNSLAVIFFLISCLFSTSAIMILHSFLFLICGLSLLLGKDREMVSCCFHHSFEFRIVFLRESSLPCYLIKSCMENK